MSTTPATFANPAAPAPPATSINSTTAASPPGYRRGLSRVELLDELRQLLLHERSVERLLCRYLADLADALEGEANGLCEATGLPIQEHQVALTLVTLAGRIAQTSDGGFAPYS